MSSVICAKFPSITTLGQIQTFYCTPNILGRYVQLEITQEWLQVCVMQVFGHSMWLILVIINIPWKIFRNRYTVLKNRIPVSKHDNNPFDKVFLHLASLTSLLHPFRTYFYHYYYYCHYYYYYYCLLLLLFRHYTLISWYKCKIPSKSLFYAKFLNWMTISSQDVDYE